MSRIVHVVIDETYKEGYSYNQNTLPAKHVELGYEVHVITTTLYYDQGKPTYIEPKNYINNDGVHVHVLPVTIKNVYAHLFINRSLGLYSLLEKIEPSIIFIHGVAAVDNHVVFKYKKKYPNVKIFMDCHMDYYNSGYNVSLIKRFLHKFYSLRTRRNNNLIEKFWGTIPWRVDFLKNVYKVNPNKVDLLIMGGDEKYIIGKEVSIIRKNIRDEYHIPQNAFLIVTGGRLDKRKQQTLLMDAVERLQKENIWLLVFGTPTEEMKPVFEKYTNVKNIVMAGWINGIDSYDLFLASDLAFFPGTHSVLWEQAVACGIPAVFKYWEGMKHVKVNNNSILLNNVTIESIVDTILTIRKTDIYNKMKEDAMQVAHHFYLKEIAKQSIK